MQPIVTSNAPHLNRFNTPVATLIVALILTSGLLIESVVPTDEDSDGRKSRSGRWTQNVEQSMPMLG